MDKTPQKRPSCGEKLDSLPKIGSKIRTSTPSVLSTALEASARAMRQEKEMRSTQAGKESTSVIYLCLQIT